MKMLRNLFGRKERSQPELPSRIEKGTDERGPFLAWNPVLRERPNDHVWRIWPRGQNVGDHGFGIAGTKHHEAAVRAWLKRVEAIEAPLPVDFERRREAIAAGLTGHYGLTLRREADNPADPNAIATYGWDDDPAGVKKLGYLFREEATMVAEELPPNTPLAAELTRVFERADSIWLGYQLLIPAKKDRWWRDAGHEAPND
jgi:hypothetical protein